MYKHPSPPPHTHTQSHSQTLFRIWMQTSNWLLRPHPAPSLRSPSTVFPRLLSLQESYLAVCLLGCRFCETELMVPSVISGMFHTHRVNTCGTCQNRHLICAGVGGAREVGREDFQTNSASLFICRSERAWSVQQRDTIKRWRPRSRHVGLASLSGRTLVKRLWVQSATEGEGGRGRKSTQETGKSFAHKPAYAWHHHIHGLISFLDPILRLVHPME